MALEKRLRERLERTVQTLSDAPEKSIPQACSTWAEIHAIYSFLRNKRVSHSAILAEHQSETLLRAQAEMRLFALEDTTTFNFSATAGKSGLGDLENKHCQGFLAHTTLAATADGVPLGVVAQKVWVRPAEARGKSKKRHTTPAADKESSKWADGLPCAADGPQGPQPHWTVVCDREAHIYGFMAQTLAQGMDFILRAMQQRSTVLDSDAGTCTPLFDAVAAQPVQGWQSLELKRHPDRAARMAEVALRFGTVTLKQPRRDETEYATLAVQFVEISEPNPPPNETGVHWLLLTSLPVTTVAEAQTVARDYSYRWLIERFHYVLKSGCRLEESQLRTEQQLERLLAVYSLVAWRLLWMTYQARVTPDAPCTVAFTQAEWQALYAYRHKTTVLPESPPDLHTAVRWLAQLGGFIGRKGDGEPGVKVLWRGYARLKDLTAAWLIYHSPPNRDAYNA